MAESRLLVPVGESVTLRSTVSEVVAELADVESGEVHFVYLASWRDDDPDAERRRETATDLLDQIEVWADYDLEEVGATGVTVETAIAAEDTYLFGPSEYANRIHEYAMEHGLDTVVIDPEYSPVGNARFLRPLEFELAQTDLTVREAPVERPARHQRLVKGMSRARFGAVFGISFLFYLLLGDPTYWFDLVSGVASALVVAVSLSQISFDADPAPRRSLLRVVRMAVYAPVLLWEIVKSNVVVARVILSPSMPIDPTMTRMRALVGSGLPLTTLANSITLTPGTLTVRARDRNLYVHTLIPWAREGLFEGSLERWTRFVFYGRSAARLTDPETRGDCAVLQGPDADEPLPPGIREGRHDTDEGATDDQSGEEVTDR